MTAVQDITPAPMPPAGPRPSLLDRALVARQLRRKMAQLLADDLFVDPAWDMMVELVIAGERGDTLCVKQLVAASGESATSAVRRLDRLESLGLVRRRIDGGDQRRVLLALTEAGRTGMVAMLDHLFSAGTDTNEPPPSPQSFRPQHGGMRMQRSR